MVYNLKKFLVALLGVQDLPTEQDLEIEQQRHPLKINGICLNFKIKNQKVLIL
jgi:hypothetical protein